MTGWIILLLLAVGVAILIWADSRSEGAGTAEDRMSASLLSLFGLALIALAVLILIGAGIHRLM